MIKCTSFQDEIIYLPKIDSTISEMKIQKTFIKYYRSMEQIKISVHKKINTEIIKYILYNNRQLKFSINNNCYITTYGENFPSTN
jgi:hypothetical protein